MKYWSEEIETMSRSEIEALQLKRLKTTLARAAHSPFYRELFRKNSINPEDIRSTEDLTYLPFTRKNDLRLSYPRGFLAVKEDEVVRMHARSEERRVGKEGRSRWSPYP